VEEKKNSNERVRSVHGIQIWLLELTVVIVVLTFVVAFSTIKDWGRKVFVREPADYIIKVLDDTYPLPDKVYETTVSELYIIKMHVSAPTQIQHLSRTKFSIKYENIGKKPIENPYLQVYLLDPLNRVFAEWENKINKEKFKKSVSFELDPLTVKGKEIYGTIHIYAKAYDRRSDKTDLVSYLVFPLQIKSEITTLIILQILSISIGVSMAFFVVGYGLTVYRHKKKEKSQG